MKILVLGATGMAGHTISIYFMESGHEVVAFSRSSIDYCNNITGDITDFGRLRKIIVEGKYDAIINAVGILNQDAENNKSTAVLINSYLPHFLSETTKNLPTRIIHMSTDCVFSGRTGGYTETSLRDGESFYDRSKALGELESVKDLTFRTSIIGPDRNEKGIGLFNWFMHQKNQVFGYTRAIWTGITTITLAKAMEQALAENLTGLYNLVNNETISKYDLIKLFSMVMTNNAIQVLPREFPVIDKSLINNREDFSFKIPSYAAMVGEIKVWIDAHKKLYPHYFLTEFLK